MKHKVGLVIVVIVCIWINIGSCNAVRYNVDTYNCQHYTRDFEELVETYLHIDVKIISGCYKDNNGTLHGHVWVEVFGIEIEPIGLFPFPNSKTHPLYLRYYDSFDEYKSKKC